MAEAEQKAGGIDFKALAAEAPSMAVALGVVAVLAVMILPLPTFVLDLLLSTNLTIGLVILLIAMYNQKPLDFSSFPAVLLVTTLFRLSLNIASTRLILLQGHEGPGAVGQVIQAFGTFVVGGNYAVGIIIFLIMVLINFIVITKGAGRIAEVAARFTLDAMPGKQMAIDADLNAGLINEEEAKARRKEISQQSEFYGAMDGASKFVRGEAVASLVIMAINIIGGLMIGVFMMQMSAGDAAVTYTLLTIGDGLVAQIPALVISTSTGIIVSRAASDQSMGKEFARQFGMQPQALGVASGIVMLLGLVPGLPTLPFISLGCIMGGLAWLAYQKSGEAALEEEEEAAEKRRQEEAGPEPGSPEAVEALLPLDTLELEVGYGLIPLVDENQQGDLLERIRAIRRQFATEVGMLIPPLHVRDNLQLKPDEYVLQLKGVEIARGEVMMGHLMAMDSGAAKRELDGIPTTEPAFQLPAVWITEEAREEAQVAGYTVVDPSTVIATHLTEVLRANAHELLGRQDTQKLLDNLAKTHPKVVEELVPGLLTLGGMQKVLQNLLRERVSIRDLLTICETLADNAGRSKDPDLLTEFVRQKLARSIVSGYVDQEGTLSVLTLAAKTEDIIRESLQQTDQGVYLNLEPNLAQHLLEQIQQASEQAANDGYQPIILCSPAIRRHLRRLLERFMPHVMVLSHNEVTTQTRIRSLGTIEINPKK
ncbi:flagellar biosynthesis protein FlhA [Desulfurivibrio alkaliphilus]|uniref:Flagellar biosynthesis protein FlhA n=1 Tax=Desulfurivibrio alkaliphilus (strain DSM 19089 / UNIQEM U267 / AHT2) TaxID=589865 RepID=D6Z4D9_DESAT|nr:flagellar biosynthesis protein FlhA [Desulfurivibrio alkaliphilus]ADH86414.1 flagellar biosynthesis protein FlhA [Desulfurivibrio alkaliphilus AHT 2]